MSDIIPVDPDSDLDYFLSWASWLVDAATLASYTMIPADPDPLEVYNDQISVVDMEEDQGNGDTVTHPAGTVIHYWLRVTGAWTEGQVVPITFQITDTDGRRDDRTVRFRITER